MTRLAGAAALVAAVAIAFSAGTPLDYGSIGCRLLRHCDDAAPAVNALAGGHVSTFFHEQRLMGPVSEVVRAPFAAIAGGDPLARYRAGLLPCLLLVAALGYALARAAARRGWPWWAQVVVAIGAVVNPLTFWVVRFGHPEELLAAVLVIAAVWCAQRGRGGGAGVLLGLAVATKLWAVAALPLLLVAAPPANARRVLATALVTAGVLIAIPALAAPAEFRANFHALSRLGSAAGTVSRTDAWFGFAKRTALNAPVGVSPSGTIQTLPVRVFRAPRAIATLGHALILVAAVLAAAAVARTASQRGDPSLWLALALVLLLRCVLDPGNRSYYHAPFFLVLLAYEVQSRRRLPWATIAAGALVGLFSLVAGQIHGDRALGAAYCAWSIPLALVLGLELRSRLQRAG